MSVTLVLSSIAMIFMFGSMMFSHEIKPVVSRDPKIVHKDPVWAEVPQADVPVPSIDVEPVEENSHEETGAII